MYPYSKQRKTLSVSLSLTQMLAFCVKTVVHVGFNGHFEQLSKDAYIFEKSDGKSLYSMI